MPHINNLFNVRVNSVSSNAAVNMGSVIFKGFSANFDVTGGQRFIGDALNTPFINNANINLMNDPDVVDQAQFQL